MIAGELFVNLGLTGADKLIKGLEGANKSLSQIKESGLEAARTMKDFSSNFASQVQNYSNFGNVLKKFEESTGLSAETLQQFQKGLLGVGVNADETRSSVVGLQNIMNDIQRGKAIPQSMALALRKAGIDPTQIKDIYGFVDKLRGVAKDMDTGIGRSIFADLGLGSDMYQGLRRFKGEFANIKPVMSRGQYTAADQTSNLIATYKFNIEAKLATMLSGKNVNKAIETLYKFIVALMDLIGLVAKIGDKTGVFDLLEHILNIVSKTVEQFVSFLSPILDKFASPDYKKGKIGAAEKLLMGGGLAGFMTGESALTLVDSAQKSIGKNMLPNVSKAYDQLTKPTTKEEISNHYQNVFYIDNKDPKAVATEIQRKMNPTTTLRNIQENKKK